MAAADVEFFRPTCATGPADPEFELLLACCGKSGEPSLGLQGSPLDWERVLRLADYHRLLPALFAFLQNRPDAPASIQSALRARFRHHVQRTLRFSAELTGILRKFQNCGIEVLSHKGLALAQALFGDPAMRQFGDLDFLIRAPDIPRAMQALQQLGYAPTLHLSTQQKRAYLRSGYEYVFGSESGKNLVELQWEILPRFYSIAFDMDSLFSRSVGIEVEGQSARVLGNEDLMLVLCAHAAKHEWAQLGMLRDIGRLASFGLDWDWIKGEAQRLGILRILLISLLLAQNMLECELPEKLKSHEERVTSEKLAGTFQLRLSTGERADPESLHYFRTMMDIRERWEDRVLFACRLAFTPSVGEWKSVAIPDPLFSLYRGVRAVRLLHRFCMQH